MEQWFTVSCRTVPYPRVVMVTKKNHNASPNGHPSMAPTIPAPTSTLRRRAKVRCEGNTNGGGITTVVNPGWLCCE